MNMKLISIKISKTGLKRKKHSKQLKRKKRKIAVKENQMRNKRRGLTNEVIMNNKSHERRLTPIYRTDFQRDKIING